MTRESIVSSDSTLIHGGYYTVSRSSFGPFERCTGVYRALIIGHTPSRSLRSPAMAERIELNNRVCKYQVKIHTTVSRLTTDTHCAVERG